MKNNICKIYLRNGFGTGFLCYFPFPKIECKFPTLITCYHVLHKELLSLGNEIVLSFGNYYKKYKITIDKSRKIYFNNYFDFTIIEIKSEDNIKLNDLLEVDNNLLFIKEKSKWENIPIYLMGYGNGDIGYSIGVIKNVGENGKIEYICATEIGSSGGPIMNLNNYRIIGLHIGVLQKESRALKFGNSFNTIVDIVLNHF